MGSPGDWWNRFWVFLEVFLSCKSCKFHMMSRNRCVCLLVVTQYLSLTQSLWGSGRCTIHVWQFQNALPSVPTPHTRPHFIWGADSQESRGRTGIPGSFWWPRLYWRWYCRYLLNLQGTSLNYMSNWWHKSTWTNLYSLLTRDRMSTDLRGSSSLAHSKLFISHASELSGSQVRCLLGHRNSILFLSKSNWFFTELPGNFK